ncbi:MAG: hypothetical protein RLZZ546_516 [Bacteroidota bacterium]|jgi:hypothetical protein
MSSLTTLKRSKIVNPINRKEVPIESEEGKKLKKLIKNCKKCLKDEIYDSLVSKCVKRNPKNLARLKDFDKFCRKYEKEVIRRKDTRKLVLGQLANIKLPGNQVKLADIIGKTKVKEALIKIEKDHSYVKTLSIIAPIIISITLFALNNPFMFSKIQDQFTKIIRKDSFFYKAFSGVRNIVNNSKLEIKPIDLLEEETQYIKEIKINSGDLITIKAIKNKRVGTVSSDEKTAKINTKILGIYKTPISSNLSSRFIVYNTETSSFEITRTSSPISGYSLYRSSNQPIITEANVEYTLKDLVVETDRKITKTRKLKSDYLNIEKEAKKITMYLKNYEEYNVSNINKENLEQEILELSRQLEEIDNQITELTQQRKVIDRLLRRKKDLETRINKIKSQIENISSKNQDYTIINKLKDRTIYKKAASIVENTSQIKLLLDTKVNNENINGLYHEIHSNISKIKQMIDEIFVMKNNLLEKKL